MIAFRKNRKSSTHPGLLLLVLSVTIVALVVVIAPSALTLMAQSCSPGGGGSTNCIGSEGGGGDGGGFSDGTGIAPTCSPIIIDISGQGFHLTSAQAGVKFDITGSGKPVQIAWPVAGAHNAFLVLDRDHDGGVTDGRELFGNFTPQPPSPHPNGFLALAEFDKPSKGGNGDGIIDHKDAIFSSLRLWVDVNHDGVAQFDELFKLPDLGVYSISLKYTESRLRDQYGNQFRYRARINVTDQEEDMSKAGPVAYDVFLTTAK
ncbi:MAG TPA: hypothetical protein VJ723_13395 [Candidatus Angelobacter sp.]|nr:hypothetical protein [Candidatus Angelobacter sp.]